LTEESVGKLRHFVMSVPDPWRTGFGGAQKNPRGSGNQIRPSRALVPKFAERRAATAAEESLHIRK
jgi:hypothetical protein